MTELHDGQREGTSSGKKILAEIWQGTVRISKDLTDLDGSILLHSLDNFPINVRKMNIGLLFLIEPDDELVGKIMDTTLMKLPSTIMSKEEMTDLARYDPGRALSLTNDYIVLSGNPPSCIDNMEIKKKLRETMLESLSEAFVHIRTVKETKDGDFNDALMERLRFSIAQTMIMAKDLHRLKGEKVRTVKPHLQQLFSDYPASRSIVLDAKAVISSGKEVEPSEIWDLLGKIGNLIFLPLMEEVKSYTPLHPGLPPAPDDIVRESQKDQFYNSILSQNLKVIACIKPRKMKVSKVDEDESSGDVLDELEELDDTEILAEGG